MTGIKVQGIKKKFGETWAVNGVSLSIKAGEFFVLVGPSGCGKTTLLRVIAGLETPDEGDVFFGEKRVTDLAPKDRNIGMVFQQYALYPQMTAFQNMEFGLRLRKIPKEERKKLVIESAHLLKIDHLLDRLPVQMSGGERQRVALGRALVRRPVAFLLDEPLSNLDAKLRVYMRHELSKIHRETNTTALYVTHDQLEAMTLSNRLAVMKSGVISQVGAPMEVYDSPGDMFVAGFLGSPPINFLDCSLIKKDGRCILDFGSFSIPLRPEIEKIIQDETHGSELTLGIRSEDIFLAKDLPIKATISTIEPLGPDALVYLLLEETLIIAKAPISSIGTLKGETGIALAEAKFHLFDRKTQKCIM